VKNISISQYPKEYWTHFDLTLKGIVRPKPLFFNPTMYSPFNETFTPGFLQRDLFFASVPSRFMVTF